MSPQVIIANGVSLYTLNHHNFSMKNDYLDSLLSTALLVFPTVTSVIGDDRKIKIKKGFFSYSYYTQLIDTQADSESLKFTKGEAVQFSWEGWSNDEARQVALALLEKQSDLKIVYDISRQLMTVYRGGEKTEIYEKTGAITRLIREQNVKMNAVA